MFNKILIVIISLFFSFLYVYFTKKNKKIANFFLILLIIILSIMFAYREYFFVDTMGNDYYSYIKWFNYTNFSDLKLQFKNLGFDILISFIKIFTSDFHVFLFICSFIINYLIINFIKENSKNFCLSTLVYICLFYYSTFNIMRQWIACAFFLYAFKYIRTKQFKKYLLFIILAALFHDSALFLILIYPIINSKIETLKKELVLLIIGIFIFINFNNFVNIILSFSESIGLGYMTKYGEIDPSFETGNYTAFIINLFIFLILNLKLIKKELNFSEKTILEFLSISLIFNLLKTTNLIFARISIYVFTSVILGFPIVSNLFEKKSRLIVNVIIFCLLIISFIKI